MTAIAKILVVFVTLASMAFAAFAGTLALGGLNWEGEIRQPSFTNDFIVTPPATPGGKYTLADRRAEPPVTTSFDSLPALVVDARQKQSQKLADAQRAVDANIAALTEQIAVAKKEIDADVAAVKERTEGIAADLATVETEISEKTAASIETSESVQKVRQFSAQRREEIFRLRNQLELLRDDLYATKAQRKVLEDELVRMEENVRRLTRRKQQLEGLLGTTYDEQAETGE